MHPLRLLRGTGSGVPLPQRESVAAQAP